MVSKGDSVFFRLPGESSKRVLHPGEVQDVKDRLCTIQLREPCDGIEESLQGFLHFEQGREFMQQSVQVMRKDSDEPPVFCVELRGKAVSAESRQCYRVSCLSSDIVATFGDETECEVLDVSATGFAVYARGRYEIGQCIRATLHYDKREYSGEVSIQSVRQLTPQKTRYGVHCAGKTDDVLSKSLNAINMAIQREQLRRLSGTE